MPTLTPKEQHFRRHLVTSTEYIGSSKAHVALSQACITVTTSAAGCTLKDWGLALIIARRHGAAVNTTDADVTYDDTGDHFRWARPAPIGHEQQLAWDKETDLILDGHATLTTCCQV